MALLAACTSSHPSTAFSCDSTCQSDINAANGGTDASEPSSAPLGPPNNLTGLGATIDNWNVAHLNDGLGSAPNCCYGPLIDTDDEMSANTWTVAGSDPVVSIYVRNFPSGTDRARALALLVQDFPADAVKVDSAMGDGCELFLYSSVTIGDTLPDLGPEFSFDLHSGGDGTIYDPSDIEAADVSFAPDLGSC